MKMKLISILLMLVAVTGCCDPTMCGEECGCGCQDKLKAIAAGTYEGDFPEHWKKVAIERYGAPGELEEIQSETVPNTTTFSGIKVINSDGEFLTVEENGRYIVYQKLINNN